MHAVGWAWMVALGLPALVVALWHRQRRHRERRLDWPASLNQTEMERYGARFMGRLGWSVSLVAGHATRSLFGCCKHGDELFVVFLRDNAFFSRLLVGLRRDNGGMAGRGAVVLFEHPTERMLAEAAEMRVTVMHYTDLPRIEALHAAVLPHVIAAQEAAQGEANGAIGRAGAGAAA